MTTPFIGEIRLFAGNFAPRGWAFCDGQLLSISSNAALFSIIGITYGGDGRTTFALPDLRGRVPVHAGAGPGLTAREQGEVGGKEAHTLSVDEMPAHGHAARASSASGGRRSPEDHVWAAYGWVSGPYSSGEPNVDMGDGAIGTQGGSQAHDNMPPYLGLRYIIALQGVFPSRT